MGAEGAGSLEQIASGSAQIVAAMVDRGGRGPRPRLQARRMAPKGVRKDAHLPTGYGPRRQSAASTLKQSGLDDFAPHPPLRSGGGGPSEGRWRGRPNTISPLKAM